MLDFALWDVWNDIKIIGFCLAKYYLESKLTKSLGMDDKSKMLLVQNPVQRLQSCFQRHFLKRVISGLEYWVIA